MNLSLFFSFSDVLLNEVQYYTCKRKLDTSAPKNIQCGSPMDVGAVHEKCYPGDRRGTEVDALRLYGYF